MLSFGVAALLVGVAVATPMPQGIDWAAVDALSDLPTVSIPIVNANAAQTTVAFEATQAAAVVKAAVLADPNDKTLERRVARRCPSDTKTPQQWQAAFNTAGEPTPAGYERVFANLKASNKGDYG
ncbi:hypothetical protein Slin15195_G083220 [Septoria linicola]|uniref:Uncharacterized protein n=1 Tax=Septoria linicola TaxID=215465 RepID=A0A9Q9AZR9_9PEZI|nr:hypothetical protein Slin14017_G085730 [Septoria linicola]USW55003.1 hypothetical protein Slin15195_G083220 [Septoria linicola]